MNLKDYIGITEDFPRPGVSFKDISPLLADRAAFSYAVDQLSTLAAGFEPTLIVGPEARGFIFGTVIAYRLGLGFVMARKDGKLPGELIKVNYALEYGSSSLTIPAGLVKKSDRVLLIDDLLATGGTLLALRRLIDATGAKTVGALTLIELSELAEQADLADLPHRSLISYRC